MAMDGEWEHWKIGDGEGYALRIGYVFSAEVRRPQPDDPYWRAILNNKPLAGFPNPTQAQACVDHTIWCFVRGMKPGYMRLLERRETWKDGGH